MMISQARVTVGWASGFLYALVANLASRTRKRFNILYLNARLSRKNVTRSLNDYTSCILLVSRVVLSLEGHCSLLMGDVQVLPHETQNTVYRYLIAISKLRLGILTEHGEGA